jgi:hypothetical protein
MAPDFGIVPDYDMIVRTGEAVRLRGVAVMVPT